MDLLTLRPEESERIAYAEGFTLAAELFARVADLQRQVEELESERYALKDEARHLEWDNQRLTRALEDFAP